MANDKLRLFEHEGSSLYLHSGNPIKEQIAKDVITGKLPYLSNAKLNTMSYAAFWILEGSLESYDLDPEKYPSLNQYLSEREKLPLLERWELYITCVDDSELDILRLAYDATRRHKFETLADAPLEEKKSS